LKVVKQTTLIDPEEFIEKFNTYSNFINPNIASVKLMLLKKEEAFCGSFQKIDIIFEFHENNLKNDI